MVYKKYIKRNGRVFGPYYYESYRENGRVKTRFVSGPKKEDILKEKIKDKRNYFVFGFIFLILCFLILAIGWVKSDSIYTGKAVLFFDPYGYKCVPKIVCTSWSDCFDENDNGIWNKTRTCLDINKCTHNAGVSEEVERCPVEEVGNEETFPGEIKEDIYLVCGEEWTQCESKYDLYSGKGIKKRICEYGEKKVIETRWCDIEREINIRKINDKERWIYDVEKRELIAKIIKGVNRIDIDFGDLV